MIADLQVECDKCGTTSTDRAVGQPCPPGWFYLETSIYDPDDEQALPLDVVIFACSTVCRDDPMHPHYDLTPRMREIAIAAGARFMPAVQQARARRARRRTP